MLRDRPGGLSVGEREARLGRSGQVLSGDELAAVMMPATNAPAPPNPPSMSDQEWREHWEIWLDFLVGAMNYGGLSVERSERT